jgi:hypothetical protein
MDGSGSYSEAGHQTASLALLGISDFGQRAERSDVRPFCCPSFADSNYSQLSPCHNRMAN